MADGRCANILSKRLNTEQNWYGADADEGAYWRYLANTIEPSVCGADAALCQTTVTTCYYCQRDVVAGLIKNITGMETLDAPAFHEILTASTCIWQAVSAE